MGVVDDGDEKFPLLIKLPSFVDETSFAFVIAAVGFKVEGLAEKA